MLLKKSIVIVLLLFGLLLASCVQLANEMYDWTNIEDTEKIEGTYHYLDDDGIKLFLPPNFKRYSTIAYLKLLDSIVKDKKALEFEKNRMLYLREMKGNHYLFYDKEYKATYSVNAMPYMPLSRQDAKFVLGIIRQNQEKFAKSNNLKYTKISAKYHDNGTIQLFRALFKFENLKLDYEVFQNFYILSSNKKNHTLKFSYAF